MDGRRLETALLRGWITMLARMERGQAAVEYAVVASAVVVAVMAAVVVLESGLTGAFTSLIGKLPK